ncbi:MAG: c-type cytochrome [Polyangia bacterium]|jgi:hypothetical protein
MLLIAPVALALVGVGLGVGADAGAQVPLAQGLTTPPGYRPAPKIVRLFEAKCATCHGEDGKANTELGREMAIADMTRASYWKDLTFAGARESVLDGVKRTKNGVDQEMKPFRDRLAADQVDALILYAASLKK